MRNGQNESRLLFLILALALALRLLFVFFPTDGAPFSDMKDYHDKACSLLDTGSYGAALRPPLYPLFLAAAYRVAGMNHIFVRSIQALMGLGVCLLTYAVARRLYGPRAGLAAGFIIACYPSLVIYTCLLMSENLFMLLFTASLFLLINVSQRRWLTCFAAGVLLGLACLTRSVLVGFIFVSALWLAIRRERAAVLGVILGSACAIAPWTVRNWHYYHRIVPIDSYGGYNFLIGNNPDAIGRQSRETLVKLRQTAWKKYTDDADRAAIGYREGLKFITESPRRFMGLGIRKMGYLYGPEIRELSWGYSRNFFGPVPRWLLIPVSTAVIAAFPIIAGFALLGIGLRGIGGWRNGGGLLIFTLLYFSLAHFISFGESRFHLPIVPALAIFAGSLAQKKGAECRVSVPRVIVAAVLLLLLSLNCAIRLDEDWERLGKILSPGGNTTNLDY